MYSLQYSPIEMKKGIIITLFKGGRKPKENPNRYRAITLLSAVYKLYERVILNKISSIPAMKSLRPLQGGFQKGIGCIMTSFVLRECIHFAMENRSKL